MFNDKHLTLYDSQLSRDDAKLNKNSGWARGEVIFKDIDTGEVLYTLHNKVIIAGSQFVAQKCFDLSELIHFPTYNEDLVLDNSEPSGTTPANIKKTCLFCCGTAGCGAENSQVYPVKYTKRIQPTNDIVPFRYQLSNNDLSPELREKYFGRKTADNRFAYYFKAFETDPTMYIRYVDGTLIDEHVYESQNETDAETFVEMSLKITKEDFRDWFRATTGIQDARINCLSLCNAWYTTDADGYRYYQDITPFTQLNIPNESLIDLTKGIDITYHIYF